jgi:hypothetical protein
MRTCSIFPVISRDLFSRAWFFDYSWRLRQQKVRTLSKNTGWPDFAFLTATLTLLALIIGSRFFIAIIRSGPRKSYQETEA